MRGESSRLGEQSTHRVESSSTVPAHGNCGLVTCLAGIASALINGRFSLSLPNSFYASSQASLGIVMPLTRQFRLRKGVTGGGVVGPSWLSSSREPVGYRDRV